MPIDVGDGQINLVLNGCLFGILAVAAITLCPWPMSDGRGRWTLWLPVIAMLLYAGYETAMPTSQDIRVDLFLIWPLLVLVALGWIFRMGALRFSGGTSAGDQE